MGDISFAPTFEHRDWVDDVDRVEAAGPNGFNVRFRAIGSDLRQMSTVVGRVGASLDAIAANPPLPVQRLTLAPLLVRGAVGTIPWTITSGAGAQAVADPAGAPTAGNLALPLTDGVRLVSLRAVGQATNLTIGINLVRLAFGASNPDPPLASIVGDTDPFDKTVTVDSSRAVVDLSTFRYFITATTSGVVTQRALSLGGLQVAYIPI
ncbi:hypothetical protein [Dactylosporangium sp. CA-092794]|uniref:hypothetical protein n=1 Tax=Dactylosporangium sp. CA-092794 TaxID=3239929 RepID=UPI003D91786A